MKVPDKYLINEESEKEVLASELKKLKLSGTSKTVHEYEKSLARFFKVKFAVAVSSGTAAIHCALWACGVKSGDEVIVSPSAPIMSATPILLLGAKPVFCDNSDENFGLHVDDLKEKISKKTKAVMVVPIWGYPFEYAKIQKILEEKSIPLIEDAAQAHGAMLRGKFLGTIGRIGCFSTHDRKILPTGEGGFLLTDNEEDYLKIKGFTQHGFMNGKDFGINYKLCALLSALGKHRIKQIKKQLDARKANAKQILGKIESDFIKELEYSKEGSPNYYSIVVKLGFEKNNLEFIKKLEERGITSDITRYGFQPMYEKKLFKKFVSNCSNCKKLTQQITTLPCHPGLTAKQINYLTDTIQEVERRVSAK